MFFTLSLWTDCFMYNFSLYQGGLTAVMYTDTFQTAIMMIGAVVVTGYGWFEN